MDPELNEIIEDKLFLGNLKGAENCHRLVSTTHLLSIGCTPSNVSSEITHLKLDIEDRPECDILSLLD